jgi:lipoprotein-anchoring transpeptidase ErfK/SrfK
MGRKSRIAALVVVVVLALLAGGAYAYDNSHKDEIADGVLIEGIEVGGMNAAEAEAAVRRELLAPLRRSLAVTYDGRTWRLPDAKLKVRADIAGAVEQAVADSQEVGLPSRLVRYVSGGEVNDSIAANVGFSRSAINRLVRHVAAEIDREPVDATVEPGAEELIVVRSKPGRKLRDNRLTAELELAVRDGGAGETVAATVRETEPEVTTKEVASRFPSYLTLDRGSYTLRLWKGLDLARTYTVAVGQEGLETPEGLYEIQAKEENPLWHVPESDWAGELAGQTIPPGPSNPIKARWMAIYEGAGIHGTEETSSLGSAASHGCVRMAIPDVEELYEEVEVGTPIFIG